MRSGEREREREREAREDGGGEDEEEEEKEDRCRLDAGAPLFLSLSFRSLERFFSERQSIASDRVCLSVCV